MSDNAENKSVKKIALKGGNCFIEAVSDNIIRCVYTKKENPDPNSAVGISVPLRTDLKVGAKDGREILETERIRLDIDPVSGCFTWNNQRTGRVLLKEKEKQLTETPYLVYTTGGEEPVIEKVQTVDGKRTFVKNLKPEQDHVAYRAKLNFEWKPQERIHGLGQGEEGIYDYRGHVQYLYQHNMRIPMPFFVSDQGYGILIDCGCLMTFNDDERGSWLYMDLVEQLDYYFIQGDSMDEIISGFRLLTGKAVMLPKWAYGYIQSKEAYRTQEEIIETATKYRELYIPLDCVVQDWNTWEDGKWGNKKVDKSRYPDIADMNRRLHDMHVHSMISVWPNMGIGTDDNYEMKQAGHLLADASTYNAFSEEARKMYWKQAQRELFSGGFDSWWCDSTEPFSGIDWNGEYRKEPWERFVLVGGEHKKFLRADRANLYAVAHARGIYENQRQSCSDKRVLNLTRSGFASSQKYGTVLWSGDICATWDTLRRQIREGLNMSMSGMPYWTLDIGGFFTVNENWRHRGCSCSSDPSPKWFWRGDYEEGTDDYGYRELYVRWFEYGAFLPLFRSHGTDTPREIWNFGQPGELFYDALAETIRLRYRLMPYIYSLAGNVWLNDRTMLRSLLFDFPYDDTAADCGEEFMFGDSLLICPVTEPMYYEKDNRPLEREKVWNCYLPKGTKWYDFYTGTAFQGGTWVKANATIGHIPVFVRAGAVIPMEEGLQYACQKTDMPLDFHVWSGSDGSFVLYEDEGDGYGCERGKYNAIKVYWNDCTKELVIGSASNVFEGGIVNRKCRVIIEDLGIEKEFTYTGAEVRISLVMTGQ